MQDGPVSAEVRLADNLTITVGLRYLHVNTDGQVGVVGIGWVDHGAEEGR